jgi:hypothetical protein
MILTLGVTTNTLLVDDLTAQDMRILGLLLAGKGVSKIETVLANLIRTTVEDHALLDRQTILGAIDSLDDVKRQAIVGIITGKMSAVAIGPPIQESI